MTPEQYIRARLPLAQAVSGMITNRGRGMPVSVILAHWGHEVGIWAGMGLSRVAREDNNEAGITHVDQPGAAPGTPKPEGGHYARFAGLNAFAGDYARILNGDWGRFPAVKRAIGEPGGGRERAVRVARALGESAWAGTGFRQGDGTPGSALVVPIDTYNLTQYDDQAGEAGPPLRWVVGAAAILALAAALLDDAGFDLKRRGPE